MFNMLISYFNKTVSKILGIIAVLLGVYSYGYYKSRQKQKQKEDKERLRKAEEVINTYKENAEVKEDIKEKVVDVEKEKKKLIKEAQKKDTYDFTKWIVIFVVLGLSFGCEPKIAYIKTPCPTLDLIERPQLKKVVMYKGMVIDNETYNNLIFNDISLKKTIEKYEESINLFNKYIDKLNTSSY